MKAKVKVIHAFALCMSVLPAQTMADTGHHADHYGKAGMPSMEHHWMAPAEAAGRRNPTHKPAAGGRTDSPSPTGRGWPEGPGEG